MQALSEAEIKIVEMINIIRKDQRKRPCFSDIFEGLNKSIDEKDKTDISIFKDSMTKLQSKGYIYDGGRGSKESFYVNDDKIKNANEIQSSDELFASDDSNVYKYINDRFHESLINMIKTEVNNEFMLQQLSQQKIATSTNNADNSVITTLKSEVEFLRNELLSKDKIIDMLVKDKCSYNSKNVNCTDNDVSVITQKNSDRLKHNPPVDRTDNEVSFIYPKISSRVKSNPPDNCNITTQNRFEMLNTTALTECENYNFDRSNDTEFYNEDTNPLINTAHNKRKYRSTTIIGDSIIKDIKQYKLKKNISKGDKVYVKSFSGATTEDMVDYIKPSLRYNPDLIILHTGVNNLRTKKSPDLIAEEIITLACDTKTNTNDVVISTLVARSDDLQSKGQQVNNLLINKCIERNIYYINNSNINASHLNSTSHLNYKGTVQLAQNFLCCINV